MPDLDNNIAVIRAYLQTEKILDVDDDVLTLLYQEKNHQNIKELLQSGNNMLENIPQSYVTKENIYKPLNCKKVVFYFLIFMWIKLMKTK